jgi:HK97 family phage major capsid protein
MILEEEKDGEATYRANDWEPLEVSIVSVPLDITVGVGRALDQDHTIEVIKIKKDEKNMEGEVKSQPIEKAEKINVSDIEAKARKDEQRRIREIHMMADKHGQRELAEQFINEGRPSQEFGVAVLERIGNLKPINPIPADIGMSPKEAKQFSIVRAINGLLSGRFGGYEKECSDAVAKRIGKNPQGFFIPDEVLKTRVLTVGTVSSPSTGAGNLVSQDLLGSSFIELLYNAMVVKKAGARILSDLSGDVLIPKITGGAAAYWVAENTAITGASAQTFTQVSMKPKTLGAYTELSRKLLLQSSMDVEGLIRSDMAIQLALAIDKAALVGNGSGATPTGILNTSGVGDVSCGGTAPEYVDLLGLWSDVGNSNAAIGSLAWVFNAKMAATLKQIYPNSTGGDNPVLMGDIMNGTILGIPAYVTNQIANTFGSGDTSTSGALTAIIFGNFADLLIGQWSGVDVIVDPYTNSSSGTVRIVLLQDVDVAIRHAESFSQTSNVATI